MSLTNTLAIDVFSYVFILFYIRIVLKIQLKTTTLFYYKTQDFSDFSNKILKVHIFNNLKANFERKTDL